MGRPAVYVGSDRVNILSALKHTQTDAMARTSGKVASKSGGVVGRPPKVVRKVKSAAGPANELKKQAAEPKKPAKTGASVASVAPVGASKRKRTQPTKKELHRRLMHDKRVAKKIQNEQARSHITACSRNGMKRMIKQALQKIGTENQINETDPIFMPNVASKAVTILHSVVEDHMVTLCNEASFLLEYAGKSTFTPAALEAVMAMRKARDQKPVYELPEREAPKPTPEEEDEEEAAFTDGSGSGSGSEAGSDVE